MRILADSQAGADRLAEIDLHAADIDLGVLDHAIDDHDRALSNPIHAATVGHELERESSQLGSVELRRRDHHELVADLLQDVSGRFIQEAGPEVEDDDVEIAVEDPE